MPTSKTIAASLFAALAILSTTTPAGAAFNAYLSLKGAKQGVIKGGVTQKGREGKIMVIAVSHGVSAPHTQGGPPAGRRIHKPLVITKELDVSSPHLMTALVTDENIPELTLQFYAAQLPTLQGAGTGTEAQTYTIKLTNAHIVSIDFKLPNTKHPEEARLNEYEEVGFVYQKIEWTWTQGGVTAVDELGPQ